MIERVEIGLDYILHFSGLPYKWCGDDPIKGFDCSGLVVEYMKATGLTTLEKYDATAHDIYIRCLDSLWRELKPIRGGFVFYGSPNLVTHITICLSNTHMIEAGGGNSSTTDMDAAVRQNAYVKVRPINRRSDIVGYADPFKGERV